MSDIIAKAFLSAGETQRLIPTGPGRSVQFRSGGAVITDEHDMPTLLMTPGITVEVLPEWADKYPSWLAQVPHGYPNCVVQGISSDGLGACSEEEPVPTSGYVHVGPFEPQPETVTTSSASESVVYLDANGSEVFVPTPRRRGKKQESMKGSYYERKEEAKPYSPKGRKLTLTPEQRQARSDRARKNFQKQPVEA